MGRKAKVKARAGECGAGSALAVKAENRSDQGKKRIHTSFLERLTLRNTNGERF